MELRGHVYESLNPEGPQMMPAPEITWGYHACTCAHAFGVEEETVGKIDRD